jgi:drug/metabolite transporter (DMT)-like permease
VKTNSITNLHPNNKNSPRAYLSLTFGVVVISFSAILLRLADAPGPVSGFYRMMIGCLVLTPWVFKKKRGEQRISTKSLRLIILAGISVGIDMILWTTGVVRTGATIPTLFANTAPVFVGLGALLFFKEKFSVVFWLGLGLALTGAVLIVGIGNSPGNYLVEGSLLGLGAAVFYAGYFLAAQRCLEYLDPLTFLWASSLVCSVVLLIATVFLGQPLTGYSMVSYLIFLGMGVVIQVGGWLLITDAQKVLPASLVSPTMLGQPVLTALIAVQLLDESLPPIEILGGLIVIFGVYIVHRSKQWNKDLR